MKFSSSRSAAFALFFAALLFMAAGCGKAADSGSGGKAPEGNLLVNPGFEEGKKGWKWMYWSDAWGSYDIADRIARSGRKSAHLSLYPGPERPESLIKGVVQELSPGTLPELASGWYRIENWKRGTPKQYLQFVVIAWEPLGKFPNYQLRYVLEGVTKPPLQIANARYAILTKTEEPPTGEWIYFEFPIRFDYQRGYGRVPKDYKKLVFLWELRYDGLAEEAPEVRADVYYDDLYVGSRRALR